ncbi:hypothetical protein K2173_018457 [Erythroxylum novogranatense]|uniref:DDE Tnp4 domain-containing protein n=1 Tax=Erythroxylum novogranatense TaxID=1862640 RepID=A0AAV8UEF9_9ROSI|nr:hypothetical protein K2173_018457 [Erythroxylum novogranatense]
MCVIQIICLAVIWYLTQKQHKRNKLPKIIREEREQARNGLMKHILDNEERCRAIVRMGPIAFLNLCDILQRKGGLQPTQRASVEEQVGNFLYLIGHSVRNRALNFFFRRSGETVSRHFHSVLRALIELEDEYLRQPNGEEVALEILNSNRFFPYFKDCIGAIDGTHMRVKFLVQDVPKFRGRKDYPTQKILASCSFNMRFTYVLPGWEGTASDSRILKDALRRQYPLKIPEGKIYLVDAGYMLKDGLITPYRGERYHLKEYSRNPPRNLRELFNHRHSSLRNVIERAFGVLKRRFAIFTSAPTFGIKNQKKIMLVAFILHNYLMGVDRDDELIAEVDRELASQTRYESEQNTDSEDSEEAARGALIRDSIAAAMWHDYIS